MVARSGAFDATKWRHRNVTWILCLHMFCYATSAGVLLATSSLFWLERECAVMGISGETCNQNTDAQSAAANRVSEFSLAQTIPNLLAVSFVGFWSDKYGRKPMLVLSTTADCLGKTASFFFMYFLPAWQGWAFVLMSISLASCAGGVFGVIAVSFSSVIDATQKKSIAVRTIECGRAEGFMLFGLLLGPFGGAYLCDLIGLDYCLAISASFNLIDLCVLAFLPETIDWNEEKRPENTSCTQQCIHENPIVSLRLFASTPISLRIGGVMCLSFTQNVGLATVVGLYLKHEFNWETAEVGALQSFQYGVNALGLVILLPLLQKFLSIKQIILMSLLCMPPIFVMYAFIPASYATPLMFSVAALSVVNAVYFPGIRVMVVSVLGFDKNGRDQRGKAFGAIGVLETLMGAIGAQLVPRIYGATVGSFSGAVFLVCAAGVLPAGFLLCGLPPFEDVVIEAEAKQRQLVAKLLSDVTTDSLGTESDSLRAPAFA